MRKFFYEITIISFFVFFLPFFTKGILAATINFDKTNISVDAEQSFSLQVNIDAGSDEIRSTDIYLNYDSNYIQAESVTEGNYFPTVTSDTSTPGQVYIAAMVDDPAVTKTGSGTVATINFKAVKDGTTNITLNCSSSKIIKADINATNILTCTQAVSLQVTIGGGGGGEVLTPTPSVLPKTGIFENLQKVAKPGIIFLIVGAFLRILL